MSSHGVLGEFKQTFVERLRFSVVAIPAVTGLGILLRLAGWSPEAAAAATLAAIAVATAVWHFGPDVKRARVTTSRRKASSPSNFDSADHSGV